jgi:hypothetical protein
MRQTNRLSDEDSWPVLATPANKASMLAPRPLPANDRAPAGRSSGEDAPPSPCAEDRFSQAIKTAASWAVAQTIFGFAAYGAALYPYFLERGSRPDEYVLPAVQDFVPRPADEPRGLLGSVGSEAEAATARPAGAPRIAWLTSFCARFGSWLVGEARSAGRCPARRRRD